MEKVIVFGLGNNFEEYKERIEHNFCIVAYSDNRTNIQMELFISPDKINEIEYDKILISSTKYFYDIKLQLVEKFGISVRKIIGLKDLMNSDEREDEQRFQKVICDMKAYKRKNNDNRFDISDELFLIDTDAKENAGHPCTHYFAQDIWGAKKILENNPKEHYDIGSRLDGFIAHLLVFRKVNYIDIRPLPYEVPNLTFIQGDATKLSNIQDNTLESISSFHAIEHFGLGRYGDPIDPDACFKAMKSLIRVTKVGGHIYIGLPIGPQNKVVFNAHRIFTIPIILDVFKSLKLMDLKIIRGDNAYVEDVAKKDYLNIGDFSCGLFEFVK